MVLSGLIDEFALVIVSEELGEFVWAICGSPWRVINVQLAVMNDGRAAAVSFVKFLFSCNFGRSYQVVLDTFNCVPLLFGQFLSNLDCVIIL